MLEQVLLPALYANNFVSRGEFVSAFKAASAAASKARNVRCKKNKALKQDG